MMKLTHVTWRELTPSERAEHVRNDVVNGMACRVPSRPPSFAECRAIVERAKVVMPARVDALIQLVNQKVGLG